MKAKVLCIDDDPTMCTLVKEILVGMQVTEAQTLGEAQRLLESSQFDAILVDIDLPDGDGLRFLAKRPPRGVPVLVISGRGEISNKVTAFSFGAEDFITKPFDPLEMRARVEAKVRRRQQDDSSVRQWGDLLLDLERHRALWREKDLELTALELKLLSLLTRRLDQVYSREQILETVWGQTNVSDRTVDSHIAHLRKKLEPTLVKIETVKNLGYRAVVSKA